MLEHKGSNAIAALQGQITQDARKLGKGDWLLTDICTPKGRVVATALAIPASNEHIFILVDQAQADALVTHLIKFFVFHRVSLRLNNDLVALAWAFCNGSAGGVNVCFSNQLSLGLFAFEDAKALWASFDGVKAAAAYWDQLLMRHGICWVGVDISDQFTPHHLAHPTLNFVSFKKGCYTGQEIIARMEYKAQLKSRLCWLEADGELTNKGILDSSGQGAGQWIKGCQIASDRWLYCADLKLSSLELADGYECGGKNLRLVTAPYAINN